MVTINWRKLKMKNQSLPHCCQLRQCKHCNCWEPTIWSHVDDKFSATQSCRQEAIKMRMPAPANTKTGLDQEKFDYFKTKVNFRKKLPCWTRTRYFLPTHKYYRCIKLKKFKTLIESRHFRFVTHSSGYCSWYFNICCLHIQVVPIIVYLPIWTLNFLPIRGRFIFVRFILSK